MTTLGKSLVLIALAMLMVTTASADDPEARKIMEMVNARDDGDQMAADLEMVLIDRRGNERVRQIKTFSKDRGDDVLQIMFFQFPPDVAGTAVLTHDLAGAEREDNQWLYLPALKKSKRIAASGKSGSFMGSDFNYSDLTTMELDNYDFRLDSESEVRGDPVWVVEAVPRSRKVIEETGYEKTVLLIRKDNHVTVRAVSWVKGGEDLRYLDVTRLETIDGIWVPTEMSMTTKRNGDTRHATILRMSNVRFDQDLPDELFTVHSLESGL